MIYHVNRRRSAWPIGIRSPPQSARGRLGHARRPPRRCLRPSWADCEGPLVAGPKLAARSEIRRVRTREVRILVVMKTERVLCAGNLRPFEAVAHIDHGCGP